MYLDQPGGFGVWRILHRGGASPADSLSSWYSLYSCETFCNYLEGGGVVDPTYDNPVPYAYYAKCFNESYVRPGNRKRFAFLSQIGSTEIDPELPQMNQANKTTCRRILENFKIFILIFFLFLIYLHCL